MERSGLEAHERAGPVQDLVDRLADVGRARVIAEGLLGRHGAAALQLHPRVRHARPGRAQQGPDARVGGPAVPAVGVAEDEDGVAGAPPRHVVGHLLEVGVAGRLVAGLGARVGVEVVQVHVRRRGVGRRQGRAHEGEALGRQAVVLGRVGAHVPLDAGEVDPVQVGQRVQAGPQAGAARRGRPERVIVGAVDVGMVVEVL